MEWTNPKYAEQVSLLRAHQAAQPTVTCSRCRGSRASTAGGQCEPCAGAGQRPAPVRGFIGA